MYLFRQRLAVEKAHRTEPPAFSRRLDRLFAFTDFDQLARVSPFGKSFHRPAQAFATLPLAPSSYVFGVLLFAVAQAAVSTTTLLVLGLALGVQISPNFLLLVIVIL